MTNTQQMTAHVDNTNMMVSLAGHMPRQRELALHVTPESFVRATLTCRGNTPRQHELLSVDHCQSGHEGNTNMLMNRGVC